jgi:hypothetical protein
MDLTQGALETIQKTAVKADGQRIVTPKQEPAHIYYTLLEEIAADGTTSITLNKEVAERAPHQHRITDFASLAKRISVAVTMPYEGEHSDDQSVWYSAHPNCPGITAILSDDYRDTAKMPLSISPQLKQLIEWKGDTDTRGVALDHKQVYNYFRRLFRGCIKGQDALMKLLQKVNFKKAVDATSEQSRSRTSLDRDMRAEATGLDDLPDNVTFKVPFFSEAAAMVIVEINVTFDPDAENEKFRIYILPNEIERAIWTAEQFLKEQIERALGQEVAPRQPPLPEGVASASLLTVCPVYCGHP